MREYSKIRNFVTYQITVPMTCQQHKCHFRNDSKNYLTFLVHPSRYIWLNKPGGWRRTWFLEMNFCLKVSSVTGHLCIQVNCLFTFSWTQWWTNLIWSFCCPFKKNSSIKFYVFKNSACIKPLSSSVITNQPYVISVLRLIYWMNEWF